MTDPTQPQTIVQILDRNGSDQEMTDAINEVTKMVRATGRKGTVTLKIDIAPAAKGDTEAVSVTDTITAKPPQLDRKASVFFVGHKGDLTVVHPDQQTVMDMRTLEDDGRSVPLSLADSDEDKGDLKSA